MNAEDREIRTESAPDASNQNGCRDAFEEFHRVLNEGVESITQMLRKYFQTFKEDEVQDRVKEQERIGGSSEGPELSRSAAGSESPAGNAG